MKVTFDLSSVTYVNMGLYIGQLCQHQHERDKKTLPESQIGFERKVEASPFLQRDWEGNFWKIVSFVNTNENNLRICSKDRCKVNLIRYCGPICPDVIRLVWDRILTYDACLWKEHKENKDTHRISGKLVTAIWHH